MSVPVKAELFLQLCTVLPASVVFFFFFVLTEKALCELQHRGGPDRCAELQHVRGTLRFVCDGPRPVLQLGPDKVLS